MALLRVGTANLLHGMAVPGGEVNGESLRKGIADLDVDLLALQEVDRGQARSAGVDQSAVAAEAMNAPWWRFVPAVHGTPAESWSPAQVDDGGDTDGPTYGVALLSRFEVLDWSVTRFAPARWGTRLYVPGQGFMRVPDEPRVAIAAIVNGPSGPFTVISTHLSFMPGWNVRQLRAITAWAGAFPTPHLLLGDLNLPGGLPRLVSGYQQLARVPTYPSWGPRVQFDHVLARGLSARDVHRVQVVRMPVSDHCALRVDVAI